MRRILAYCAAAAVLYFMGVDCLAGVQQPVAGLVRAVLLMAYVGAIVKFEKIPLPGRRAR